MLSTSASVQGQTATWHVPNLDVNTLHPHGRTPNATPNRSII